MSLFPLAAVHHSPTQWIMCPEAVLLRVTCLLWDLFIYFWISLLSSDGSIRSCVQNVEQTEDEAGHCLFQGVWSLVQWPWLICLFGICCLLGLFFFFVKLWKWPAGVKPRWKKTCCRTLVVFFQTASHVTGAWDTTSKCLSVSPSKFPNICVQMQMQSFLTKTGQCVKCVLQRTCSSLDVASVCRAPKSRINRGWLCCHDRQLHLCWWVLVGLFKVY